MNKTSQDENYSNNQLEDIVLMYQQTLRTLKWREMKDSEARRTESGEVCSSTYTHLQR